MLSYTCITTQNAYPRVQEKDQLKSILDVLVEDELIAVLSPTRHALMFRSEGSKTSALELQPDTSSVIL